MKAVLSRFALSIRDGFALFWLAPLIAALIVVPEFVQHIAEIRIGMFESKEAFTALADDPRRMFWGFLKIAGFLLAILATIRFGGHASSDKNGGACAKLPGRILLLPLS